ncbi:hypothetical protein AB4562_01805 [Vibrio sp. 10N.222.54.A1]|uniref:hypothetical protein n=1 Tax=unclassified Vibrio TaxID=2614977 RepID=UPI00354D8AB1
MADQEVIKVKALVTWNISEISRIFNLSRDTVRSRLKLANVQSCGQRGNAPIYPAPKVGPALFGDKGAA